MTSSETITVHHEMTNSKYLTLICGLQPDTKNELMLSKHPTS